MSSMIYSRTPVKTITYMETPATVSYKANYGIVWQSFAASPATT